MWWNKQTLAFVLDMSELQGYGREERYMRAIHTYRTMCVNSEITPADLFIKNLFSYGKGHINVLI